MGETVLKSPCVSLMAEYLDFCRETWGQVHNDYIVHRPPPADADLAAWSATVLRDCADGETNPAYATGPWVNHWRFWAFQDARMVAAFDFRRRLTPTMERYGGHWGVAVRPSERRRGWLAKLIPLMMGKSASLGVPEVLLTTTTDNLAVRQALSRSPFLAASDEVPAVVDGKAFTSCRYRLLAPTR